MKLDDYKSLDEIPEKEMLKFILANQIQILRELNLSNSEPSDFEDNVRQSLMNTTKFISGINSYLSKDDIGKGKLKL